MGEFNKSYSKYVGLILLGFMLMTSCKEQAVTYKHEINVNLSADPETLHPHYHISIPAIHICKHIFQPLIDFDYNHNAVRPVLASSLPRVIENENTKSYFFTIRNGAKWSDGEHVTSKDVVFSFKLLKNPIESNHHLNTAFDALIKVNEVEGETNAFELVFEKDFQNVEMILTSLLILPSHIYDPNRILSRISFEKLEERPIDENTSYLLGRFAKIFGNPFYHDNPKYIIGSGPYNVESWEHDKKLVLVKKLDWYGEAITDNMFFQNEVGRINYIINEDQDVAISKLLLGEIDVFGGLSSENIKKLESSDYFQQNFVVNSPTRYSFTFLGMHLKNKFLQSMNVRKAIAHSVDKQHMIDEILGGFGETVVGPRPIQSEQSKIKDYRVDIVKAKHYLSDDGWGDANFDGYLDRMKDGKQEQLVFHLSFARNETAKKIAEYIQLSLREIGIRIILMELDFSTFVELNKRHKFDLCLSNFQTFPSRMDPKNIWHSDSYEYGTNWMGFGNEASDVIVHKIRTEQDPVKRVEYEQELEQMIHENLPCLFLFAPKHRIVLNKQIQNAQFSSFGLGFWEANYTK